MVLGNGRGNARAKVGFRDTVEQKSTWNTSVVAYCEDEEFESVESRDSQNVLVVAGMGTS